MTQKAFSWLLVVLILVAGAALYSNGATLMSQILGTDSENKLSISITDENNEAVANHIELIRGEILMLNVKATDEFGAQFDTELKKREQENEVRFAANRFIFEARQFGKERFQFTATDSRGASVSKAILISVHPGIPRIRGAAQNCQFSDTDDELVAQFCQAGIITGHPDGSFRPANTINRAELATVVYKLLGEQGQINAFQSLLSHNSISPFRDTPGDHWAAAYIALGKQAGSLQGYADGNFIGHQDIIRSEAWKLMTDAAAAIEPSIQALSNQVDGDLANQVDVPWFQAYHEFGRQIGMGSYLELDNRASWQIMAEPISRLEILQFLNQLLTRIAGSRS